jgi:hypothetical protein
MIESFASASGSHPKPRRLLWIVNHRTLLPAEVPLLRSLGWEVFIPKVIPDHDPGYRSAMVTYEYDAALQLPKTALQILNRHNFYERDWSPTIESVLSENFSVLITHFSYYTTPLSEAARKFPGRIIARAFGREHPRTYTEFTTYGRHKTLLSELETVGDRFIFAQGYNNLADIEAPVLQRRAHVITVPLPNYVYLHQNTWRGTGRNAVFLCPAIKNGTFYGDIYQGIKRDFGHLPHVIFGRQVGVIDDAAVLPYLTEDELFKLYADAPVFVYPHTELRHIHYSPLEAMIVGTPTLYMRGALIDILVGGADLPGACENITVMREKAQRLLSGDKELAQAIRSAQGRVLDTFAVDLARRQWMEALPNHDAVALAAL